MRSQTTDSMEVFVHDIPLQSTVVFDWDNTLKVSSSDRKTIESNLCKESLDTLVLKKMCTLYILSAIRPTRMNLDTLLLEVDRLGLRRYFCPECRQEGLLKPACTHNIAPALVTGQYTYASWGNIIICGYDKAEVFLLLMNKNKTVGSYSTKVPCDEVDGVKDVSKRWEERRNRVYFFDDEVVNIYNFQNLVRDSVCVLVERPNLCKS